MEKSKKFVSWTAVSSLPQAKRVSLAEQSEMNRMHIAKHGGTVLAELIIPGESRDIDLLEDAVESIPAYARLRELIRTKAFDVLICLNRSRLGRTLALIESIAQLCRRAQIVIYETESPPASLEYSGDSYDNLLVGAIKSAGAQREIAEMQRRHQMGMLGRFNRGDFLAKIPYGWKAEYTDAGDKYIAIDPDAASAIRLMLIELGLERGLGYKEQARELNQRGLKSATGNDWTRSSVRQIWLHLYRYAGIGEINRVSESRPYARTKGNWPPIISDDELQRLLTEHQVRKNARRVAQTYRFSRIVWCEKCNCRMNMQYCYTKNRNKHGEITSRYYHEIVACRSGQKHKGAYMVIGKVERAVRDLIASLQDRTAWVHYLGNDSRQGTEVAQKKIDKLSKEIERTKVQILIADDHLMDGKFDADRHAHQVKRLESKMEGLHHEITLLDDKIAQLQNAEKRRDRLEELANHGIRYLEMKDQRRANAKLRSLIRVWVADGAITSIDVL